MRRELAVSRETPSLCARLFSGTLVPPETNPSISSVQGMHLAAEVPGAGRMVSLEGAGEGAQHLVTFSVRG